MGEKTIGEKKIPGKDMFWKELAKKGWGAGVCTEEKRKRKG